MPDIAWNRKVWDRTHEWGEDGDEWSGMAAHCRQPYSDWKAALISELIEPHLSRSASVVEVAPGHGRFTAALVGKVAHLTLVDLSQSCLDVCRDRFGQKGIDYVLTDGSTLPGVPDTSVDFVWSFDSFVHMEADVVGGYLSEFARVLKPGGEFVIHHADKRDWSLRAVPLTRRSGGAGRVAQRILSQGRLRDSGRRADVSAELVERLARQNGLDVLWQRDSWGPRGEFTVAKYHDVLTAGRAPD